MTSKTGYSRLQIGLHWLIAVLILAAWITGDGNGRALRVRLESGTTDFFSGNTPHVWIGLAVFALILIRIVVRLVQGAPGAVPGSSPMMETASLWGHRLLYLLMIVVPLVGMLTWFAGFTSMGDLHALAGNALAFVALGHAALAILHQVVLKDGTLTRMLRPGG